MTLHISRRDFLKLSASLPAAALLDRFPAVQASFQSRNQDLPNILIVVFDALSASNLSLYGYHRKTTPNLERFADR